jgi:hypothetical protein
LETPGELARCSNGSHLPLADVRIEPIGLWAVYQRYHTENGSM